MWLVYKRLIFHQQGKCTMCIFFNVCVIQKFYGPIGLRIAKCASTSLHWHRMSP
jgi:hypothetical protein